MGAVVGTHDDLDVVRALAQASPDGLVVRRGARTEWASDAAYAIMLRTGLPAAEALRQLGGDVPPSVEDGSPVRRQVRIENPATRTIVHLETSVTNLSDGRYAVWLRDLGEQRAQHDRITAIAMAALSVADTGSLDTTLTTLAREVRLAAGLAAVQVVTVHGDDPLLRIIGRSGFGPADDFSLRLDRARRGGAHLMLTTAVREKRAVIALHRKAEIMQDPLWEPMHAIFAEVDWDCFGAFPIIARDRVVGVLIAFFHPGADPDDQMIELISDLADQAALAVDYATLIAISRDEARRRERERIATDLHDSVVQQVFSIRLLARALEDSSAGTTALEPASVQRTAGELVALSAHTLADLRDLIFELRPTDLAQHGFAEAIRVHANAIEARTGLLTAVSVEPGAVPRSADAQEDIYRIVTEAMHNALKHAQASRVSVQVRALGEDFIEVTVADDGRGLAATPTVGAHVGITSMRERARKGGGSVTIDDSPTGGVVVRAVMPRGAAPRLPSTTGEGRQQ